MSTRKLLAFGLAAALLGGAASLIERDVSSPPSIPTEATVDTRPASATHAKPLPTLAVSSTTSMDDLIGRLDSATTDEERRDLSREMHDALVAALQRDPEGTLAQLRPWLMEADPAQRATQVALGAMVAVGSPSIQTTLVDLVNERADDAPFVRTALPTMSFLAQPTRETEGAVRSWTSDGHDRRMQSMAHLSLGTMASRLAKGDATRASAIVDEYAARLSSSTEPADRARWLQVLGNVHTPEAARVVTAHLGAEDPQVRSRAVEALRLAPTPGVDSMLTKALDDADPGVRASAAWSLGYRAPDAGTMRAMTAKLSEEQDVAVVTKLLDVLWIRRATDRVAIVGAVERVAREHPSEKVRTYAQQLLDTAS